MTGGFIVLCGSTLVAALPTQPSASIGAEDFTWNTQLTFEDDSLYESSGLVTGPGVFFTVNDSGDKARVYSVDASSGQIVGTTQFASKKPRDVEAMAKAPDGRVWVADIGDNRSSRANIALYDAGPVPAREDVTTEAKRYVVKYDQGSSDAESFAIHPQTGQKVIVTKAFFGGDIYTLPKELSPDDVNVATRISSGPLMATDAAFFPDGNILAVRTYSSIHTYTWPDLKRLASRRLPAQQQGETLAISENGEVYVGSEGKRQPLLKLVPKQPWSAQLDDDGNVVTGETTGAVTSKPSEVATPSPSSDAEVGGPTSPLKDVVPRSIERFLPYWPLPVGLILAGLIFLGWVVRPSRS